MQRSASLRSCCCVTGSNVADGAYDLFSDEVEHMHDRGVFHMHEVFCGLFADEQLLHGDLVSQLQFQRQS